MIYVRFVFTQGAFSGRLSAVPRITLIIAALLALMAPAAFAAPVKPAAPATATPAEVRLVDARYVGHKTYPSFTRLVFDTGGQDPANFKVEPDYDGGKVVFHPIQGNLIFSFVPVRSVDDLVREVDFIQDEGQSRGVVVRFGLPVSGVRVSKLSDPARLVLDVFRKTESAPASPAARLVRTVVIDPGHGGKTTGASGPDNLKEKDVALDVALRLRRILMKQGIKVLLTRNADADVTPDDRAGFANNARADLYVSIHASGSFVPGAAAPTVYTVDAEGIEDDAAPQGANLWDDQQAPYMADSDALAGDIAASLAGLGGQKPVIRQTRLAGFGGLTMPAVMVEAGNLSDPEQGGRLGEDSYRDKLAGLISKGINDYAKGVDLR